jgi:hypothetical protein
MHKNELAWFTDYGKAKFNKLNLLQEDKTNLRRRKQIKEGWMGPQTNKGRMDGTAPKCKAASHHPY